jgi:hypothetical protein
MSRAPSGAEPFGDLGEHGVPDPEGDVAVKVEDGKEEDIDAVSKVDPDSTKKMVATIVESVSAAKKHVSKMASGTSKLSKKEDWSRWREGVSMALSQHGLVWLLSASGLEESKLLFSEWVAGRLEYFGGDVGAEIDWDRGGTTFLRHIRELSSAVAFLIYQTVESPLRDSLAIGWASSTSWAAFAALEKECKASSADVRAMKAKFRGLRRDDFESLEEFLREAGQQLARLLGTKSHLVVEHELCWTLLLDLPARYSATVEAMMRDDDIAFKTVKESLSKVEELMVRKQARGAGNATRAQSREAAARQRALQDQVESLQGQMRAFRLRVGRGGDAQLCFSWRDRGECPYGENCRFQHPEDRRGTGRKKETEKSDEQ